MKERGSQIFTLFLDFKWHENVLIYNDVFLFVYIMTFSGIDWESIVTISKLIDH